MTDDTTARAGQKCSQRVRAEGRWLSFHQCSRPGSVERDGEFFCKQHDPVAVRSKLDARDAKWKSDWNATCAKNARTAAALRSFEPMWDALKEAVKIMDDHRQFLADNYRIGDPKDPELGEISAEGKEEIAPWDEALETIRAALALANGAS